MQSKLGALFDALLPVLATLAALALGAVMLLFLGVNPITAYKALWDGAFGSTNSIAETLVKATPLLLVGLGICISFRGDVINIGGEGQMVIGGLLAPWVGLTFTDAPGWIVNVVPPPATVTVLLALKQRFSGAGTLPVTGVFTGTTTIVITLEAAGLPEAHW